eukprot:TRINITY_DN2387_c0_g1_i1.p1 TRINITY_DN2387_c0_g1~~TRINITY_DN2387_c0_g1_i1.p1  ORF type:complete len:146 (-),score=50.62 TRINITY_DN2387_c0_g1_i1:51-458(-)
MTRNLIDVSSLGGKVTVLIIGVKTLPPNAPFTPEQLDKMLQEEFAALKKMGVEHQTLRIENDAESREVVSKSLREQKYDAVVIGGGLRGLPQNVNLLEDVVELIREHADPSTKIVFTPKPDGTCDSLKRFFNFDN